MKMLEALEKSLTKSKEYSDKTYSNALKGKMSGAAVSMDDVAQDALAVVNLRSKNLIPYPYRNATQTKNGVTFTDNGDGSITINGTPTALTSHILVAGKFFSRYVKCKLGGSFTEDGLCISLTGDKNADVGLAFETNVGVGGYLYLLVGEGNTYDNVTVYPQLEYGTVATPYTPYVANDKAVTVKSCGKNLIPYPYRETTKTMNGITFTDNGDGSVTINGQLIENKTTEFECLSKIILPVGAYTFGDIGGKNVAFIAKLYKGDTWQRNWNNGKIEITNDIYGGGYYIRLAVHASWNVNYSNVTVYPQLEYGTTATPYEPYIEGETIETTLADGAQLDSIAPNMTIQTDNNAVCIEANYNKDTNIVIEKLTQAIISLGGNI